MNKREKQYSDSSKMTLIGMIGILVIIIWTVATVNYYNTTDPQLEDWLSGNEKNLLDTMKSIMPEGKGIIEYSNGTQDSIKWEYHGKEGKSEYGEYE